MITKEMIDSIQKEAELLFTKLQSGSTAKASMEAKDSVFVEITMADPQLFIGERGQTLGEIQHALRLILRKKLQEPFFLFLDINEYKKNKEASVKELAKEAADEVALLKKEKELPTMNSSERRIVHMALAERSDVVAQSIGEEPDRRVVIKPV